MPRGTTSKGGNSTNFLQFNPNNFSSPVMAERVLNKKELDLHVLEHTSHVKKVADDYKSELMRYCAEEFKEFDKAVDECLSRMGDCDFIVTPKILKECRKMIKQSQTGGKKYADIIKDATEDDAEIDEPTKKVTDQDCVKGTSVVPESENNKTKEGNDAFKKPTGTIPKTRQASTSMNKNQYKTPKPTNYRKGYNIARVTPGPDIDRPLAVIRRPVPGEIAVSLNGSPLVTTHENISVPQMTIPLTNGRTLTYLANNGLDPDESICGDIDEETKERLTVMYKLLERNLKKRDNSIL